MKKLDVEQVIEWQLWCEAFGKNETKETFFHFFRKRLTAKSTLELWEWWTD